jgi:hypothetical protein
MKKILSEGNQIHNFISSSSSGTVINYGSGSDFLTSYGSGSTRQKVTVPTVPFLVPVPKRWLEGNLKILLLVFFWFLKILKFWDFLCKLSLRRQLFSACSACVGILLAQAQCAYIFSLF